MESYFIKELVPYIDQHYQTINNRRARAIGGLSSGGFGAMYVGLRNNNLFSYIFSHSGYMINNESIMNQLIVNFNKNRNKYSPLKFVDRIKFNQPLFIYFDIGKDDDHNFIQSNYLFDQKLSQLKIDHVFKLTEGRHGWKVWGKNIDNSLSYLTKLQTAKFQ